MSQKYKELAKEIVRLVGGKDNINGLIHCQTRLRFDLKDEKKADVDSLKQIKEVLNVTFSGGQFQVVIGMHVSEVYDEVSPLISESDGTSKEDKKQSNKKNILTKLVEFISGVFSPVIPAMAGAGMVKALLALLVAFGMITRDSQSYNMVNLLGDAVFYFLPFFLAVTAANKLKANPYISMALAGALLHPNFIALVATGKNIELFNFPVKLVNYGSSVIPILLIVFFQSYIERFFSKIIPEAVKIVFVPMLTIFVTGVLAFTIVGPAGSYVGGGVAAVFEAIRSVAPWAPAVIVGSLLPVMVMFGIHTSIGPLDVIQLTSVGYANIFGPGAMVSNIATGTAALVTSFVSKSKKDKSLSTSTGITALMGITEPALYGVNLPKKYPLISSMIGGGIGGLYAGLSGASRFATGSSGLPSIPLYINEDLSNVINICIAIAITIVSTAIITYLLSFKFEKKSKNNNDTTLNNGDEKDYKIFSPGVGNIINLSDVDDQVFSSKALGNGFALEPTEGTIYAPFSGKILSIFPTKHAIGLLSDSGIELLIHIGLDTVELNGKYFETFVIENEHVRRGQKLISFDLEGIKSEGYNTQIPIIITNSSSYSDFEIANLRETKVNDEILQLKVEE